jgi:hypothetical protein
VKRALEVILEARFSFDREVPESVRCLRSLGAEFIRCPLATNTSDMSQLSLAAHNENITQNRTAEIPF